MFREALKSGMAVALAAGGALVLLMDLAALPSALEPLILILFALALTPSALIARLEARVEFNAGARA